MTEDQIDSALHLEPVEPSAVFQTRIMRRIRQEAATPPPIPFPWRRAVWIALALVAGFATALVQPEVAAASRIHDKWLWCLGAAAGSAAAAILPLRLLRLR